MNETVTRRWQPTLGAVPSGAGVTFAVWAPDAGSVDIVLEPDTRKVVAMEKSEDGVFRAMVPELSERSLYRYRVNGNGLYPDPASRFQPQGVHGPSQVVDLRRFKWGDHRWRGVPLKEAVIYEAHVGTFTPEGTFAGLVKRLPYLSEMGITALELMPVADFDGSRNWGYDNVSLFAPARCYGTPEDLQRLIDEAHRLGLAVILDAVYNHLGPSGNYLSAFSPYYFSNHHHTPWGSAVNLDGNHSNNVREFFLENALHWIHEYHADGLRLDATHAIVDDSSKHFLAELADQVRGSASERHVLCIAEDCRNLAWIVKPPKDGGWGLDAVWSDDFHHEVRRSLAGDQEGYYRDFSGSLEDLCRTIRQGWFFCGQPSQHFGGPRGTEPDGIPPERFVFFLQNHDQIGNRAFGERLNHQIDPAAYRAASVLLLSVPETPLLFMGQEWGASSPFLYFTDHAGELGHQVTEGRRSEFKDFSSFSDPMTRQGIPDPQDPATFKRSLLNWEELDRDKHKRLHRLHCDLLRWRRETLGSMTIQREDFTATAINEQTLWLEYWTAGIAKALIIIQWRGGGHHELPANEVDYWQMALTSEDSEYCSDPQPIRMDGAGVHFQRPGAVILRPQR